jgi:hypothetical protein
LELVTSKICTETPWLRLFGHESIKISILLARAARFAFVGSQIVADWDWPAD